MGDISPIFEESNNKKERMNEFFTVLIYNLRRLIKIASIQTEEFKKFDNLIDEEN